jgi:hypothetical protein
MAAACAAAMFMVPSSVDLNATVILTEAKRAGEGAPARQAARPGSMADATEPRELSALPIKGAGFGPFGLRSLARDAAVLSVLMGADQQHRVRLALRAGALLRLARFN